MHLCRSPGLAAPYAWNAGWRTRGATRLPLMTEIGFVSLIVAGFGGLAGVLVYLGVRVGRRA